jgi:short-subunit dehydrogenase
MDFNRINEALHSEEQPSNVNVTIVTLGGVATKEVAAGTTIEEFKSIYNLEGTKIVDTEGNALANSDRLTDDIQIVVSTPKQNG